MNPKDKKVKKNKKVFAPKENKKLFSPSFENFDPVTGEKIAQKKEVSARLANMEAASAAKGTREAPSSTEETIKDVGTGTALGSIGAHALMRKERPFKTKAIIGLGAGALAGYLSRRKQKSEYNKQQAAREFLAGGETQRGKQYKGYLSDKYDIGKKEEKKVKEG